MKIKIDTTNRIITLIESVSAKDLGNIVNLLTNEYGEDWKITIEENTLDRSTIFDIPDVLKSPPPKYPLTGTPYIPPYTVTSNDEQK